MSDLFSRIIEGRIDLRACKDCGIPVQINTFRGRPKEYCTTCYERRKKTFSGQSNKVRTRKK